VLPGWGRALGDVSARGDLPDAARAYVEFVESELQVPVELVGIGAARENVLVA
jgi:adenylosuccinate synthase